MPEFDLPPLDPLFYKYNKAEFVLNNIRTEAIISNLSVIGLSKARFSDVRTHFLDDVFRLEIDVQVPKLFAEAIVKINSSLNGLAINSEGMISFTQPIRYVFYMYTYMFILHIHIYKSIIKIK